MLMLLPNRQNERTDTLLPICKKSNTDKLEPARVLDHTDMLEPSLKYDLKLKVLPHETASRMERQEWYRVAP